MPRLLPYLVPYLLPYLVPCCLTFTTCSVENYVCPTGFSSESLTVNNKARLTFALPGGKKTPHNLNCTAHYVLGTCAKVKLQCNFKMKGGGINCSSGDKAVVTYGSKTITSVGF